MARSHTFEIVTEKRPCTFRGKRAIFHQFVRNDDVLTGKESDQSTLNIIPRTCALVELEGGRLRICELCEIRFCDTEEQLGQFSFDKKHKKPPKGYDSPEYAPKDLTEFNKLRDYLFKRKIDFEERHCFTRFDDSFQKSLVSLEFNRIAAIDSKGEIIWDAICHKGSYGAEQGLLEIRGSIVRGYPEGGEVEGYLTAADVIERISGIAVLDLK